MISKNRIHWVDGMLINKSHFIGMEDFLLSNIYTSNQLISRGSYGIIPINKNVEKNYPWIKLSIDASDSNNQKIIVDQVEFYGMTPAGTLIDVSNESFFTEFDKRTRNNKTVIVDVDKQKVIHADPLYLVLLVQPFDSIGVGENRNSEEPLRLPYCKQKMELRCVSSNSDVENIVGPNHFPIGRIKIINHKLEIDRNYLPPCFLVSAHHELFEGFLAMKQGLAYLINGIDKFLQENQNNSDKNISVLKEIFYHIYFSLIDKYTYLDEEKEFVRPFEIIRLIRVLALQLKKSLLVNGDAHSYFVEIWNSKFGINFHNVTAELEIIKNIKSYDINEALIASQRILDDYLCRIAAITNYNTGYVPKPMKKFKPDADYEL